MIETHSDDEQIPQGMNGIETEEIHIEMERVKHVVRKNMRSQTKFFEH